MHEFRLDALASFLAFAGTVVLAVDALRARQRASSKSARDFFFSIRRRNQKIVDEEYESWLANLSFRLAIAGLALIIAGFLLDLYLKTGGENALLLHL